MLFAAIMGLTLLQVVNRYALGWQVFWTEEVVRRLLVWIVMLATPSRFIATTKSWSTSSPCRPRACDELSRQWRFPHRSRSAPF